jgi:hypothetical protein
VQLALKNRLDWVCVQNAVQDSEDRSWIDIAYKYYIKIYTKNGRYAGLVKVEAVEGHHLVPGVDELLHEFLLAVLGGVDLRDGAESGV